MRRLRVTVAAAALLALGPGLSLPTGAAEQVRTTLVAAAATSSAGSPDGGGAPDLSAVGHDGTPLPPTAAQVRALRLAQSRRSSSASPGVDVQATGALIAGYPVGVRPRADVDRLWWPYARVVALPLDDGRARDATGVAMVKVGTTLYDHPVVQAQDGFLSLESYRVSQDRAHLDRAIADAQRLVDRRVESRGGWFYPYPFDFALHHLAADTLRAPWYSAMAQGQALTLFVRLFEVTGDPAWRTAADRTFVSLELAPVSGQPSVAFRDSNGQLWLEEYANPVVSKNDRTWNGMIFASFGVWDYWRLTQSPDAEQVFQGVMSTVQRYVNRGIRRTSWVSAYCLRHAVLDPKYHATVTGQLLYLQALTGSSSFAVHSDVFRDDYVAPSGPGTVVFAAGSHLGYTFNAAGGLTGSRRLVLSRTSTAPGTQRMRIQGRGYYYRITAGSLTGYWVPESFPTSYLRGFAVTTRYAYPRTITYPAGPTTAWALSDAGATTSPVSATAPPASTADRVVVFNGERWARVTSGAFSGLWVRYAQVVVN